MYSALCYFLDLQLCTDDRIYILIQLCCNSVHLKISSFILAPWQKKNGTLLWDKELMIFQNILTVVSR